MKAKPRAPMSPDEKAVRTKPLTLKEWLAQPTVPASRQQVYLVAKMCAQAAVTAEREQAKYRRWHRRLWAALQRLFAPPRVELDLGETAMGPAGPAQPGEDAGDDPRPAELAAAAEQPTEELESGVRFRDKRQRSTEPEPPAP